MNIKGLREISQELIRQLETKKDYIADTKHIMVHYDNSTQKYNMHLVDMNTRFNEITDICHNQIGTKLNIPNKYYQYLKENYPELLEENINTLMSDTNKRRMIRTVDGKARAFLSDRFRPIDNIDVLHKTLNELNTIKNDGTNIKINDARLTDTNLYIKATSPDLTDTIYGNKTNHEKGDIVNGGIIVSNSEIGFGSYKVMPFINIVICNNGMIRDKIFKRVHLGKQKDEQIINWSEHTNTLEENLLWSKLTDMIHNTFNKETFTEWINEINGIAGEHIAKPTIAVNKVINTFPEITKDKAEQLLVEFTDYGHTKWGLCQAITHIAQQEENYDTQIKYEQIGTKILEMEIE